MSKFISSSFESQDLGNQVTNTVEWEVIPYPYEEKIRIPYDANYVTSKFCIHGRMWIDSTEGAETNILSMYSDETPQFYFGYSLGVLRWAVWNDGEELIETTVADPTPYLDRWVDFSLYYNGFSAESGLRLENDAGNTDYEYTMLTSSAYSNLNPGTNDIISGTVGRLKDIIFYTNITGNWTEFNNGGYIIDSNTIGFWRLNNNDTTLVDSVGGNDGLIVGDLSVGWDNPDSTCTVTNGSWNTIESANQPAKQLLLSRTIPTSASKVILGRSESDPLNKNLYSSSLTIKEIADSASGVEMTFKEIFRIDKQNHLIVNKSLDAYLADGVTDYTVPAGTVFNWNAAETDLDDYEVTSIKADFGKITVKFNTALQDGTGIVNGVDAAFMFFDNNKLTIKTDNVGTKTITLSGFKDVSGNPIPEHSETIIIPSKVTEFFYNGVKYKYSSAYNDTFSDKVTRDIIESNNE